MLSERPDRSDAHLPPEEAAKREAEVREYFDGIAPKRHPKPSRSDGGGGDDRVPSFFSDSTISELDRLRDLKASDPQKLVCDPTTQVVEEYVETDYYNDLNCIDKDHHTTGTGFIKTEQTNVDGQINLTSVADASGCRAICKGNPATNEWIPSCDTVIPVSRKPNRSDN